MATIFKIYVQISIIYIGKRPSKWAVSSENIVNKTNRSNSFNRTSISSIDCQIYYDFARCKSPYFSDKTLINLFLIALVFNMHSFLTKGDFGYKSCGGKRGN